MELLLSIRSRLMQFVVACLVLTSSILYYDAWTSKEDLIEMEGMLLQAEAEATAASIDQVIRSTANLLNTFRLVPQLRKYYKVGANPCEILNELIAQDLRYSSGYIIHPDGLIDCFSLPIIARGDESSREYFRRAMASGKVEVGNPTICRSTDTFCFPIALAVRNDTGQVTSVLALDLDPVWIAEHAKKGWANAHTFMEWWDRDNRIAFAWPKPDDWFGKTFTNNHVAGHIQNKSTGYFLERDIDGIDKIFGYSTIRGIGHPDLKLTLSAPIDELLAPVYLRLIRDLTLMAVAALFLLLLAWLFGSKINRKFNALTQMVFHMGVADRRAYPELAYTGINKRRKNSERSYSNDEFGALAHLIDSASESRTTKLTKLRESELRLRTIVERLSESVTLYKLDGRVMLFDPTQENSDSWLRTTLENLADGVSLYDLDSHLLYCNHAVVDMLGFSSMGDYRRSEFEFAEVFELTSPDGKICPENQWPLARILQGEELNNLEMRVRNKRMGWDKTFTYSGILTQDSNEHTLMAVIITRAATGTTNKQ